jgi:UDP-N-acetylmuramoyl-L-alanyl-D-glutamate--2,6-diaminopimelate ligase
MKTLAALLAGITFVDPEMDCTIHGLSIDSRQVKKGDLFIAYPGEKSDGRDFIQEAFKKGVAAVLAEEAFYAWPLLSKNNILLKTKDVKHTIGQIATRFYNHPSRQMHITGVTGTNGKSSIAYLLACALNTFHRSSIYFGTLGTGFPDALQESTHTTLDPIHLQKSLAHFLKQGVTHAALEVSSHALDQGRVSAVEFETAVFTNLTRDHLDYHKTMEAYGEAKAKLFYQFGLKTAVINQDDAFGVTLSQSLSPEIFKLGYSLKNSDAEIFADNVLITYEGIQASINTPWGEGRLKTPLLGYFNLYNILAVIGVLGPSYPLSEILTCIETLPHVPGRMECITSLNKPMFVVDYAHTPDALKNVLTTAKDLLGGTSGKLWCVFGCGGDRDKGKRTEMGKMAEALADHCIITNDNPRTEDPQIIAQEIMKGMSSKNIPVILDREEAITHAFKHAQPNDIILIAGKGHEPYQIIGTEKHYFSDQDICRKLVA